MDQNKSHLISREEFIKNKDTVAKLGIEITNIDGLFDEINTSDDD